MSSLILTTRCALVALLMPMLVGVPVMWLCNRRRPLRFIHWILSPFAGLCAIILPLQNLVYFDIRLGQSTAPLWAVTALLWIWMLFGGLRKSGRHFPLRPFACAIFVFAVQSWGLWKIGAAEYVGGAWTDEYHYVSLAQFLMDEPYSTSLNDIGFRPWMVVPVARKADRLAQSVLQGSLAVTADVDAKTMFMPTILLGAPLLVLASYLVARRLGMSGSVSSLTAVFCGVLPGTTFLQTRSILSEAFFVSLLLLAPALARSLTRRWNAERIVLILILGLIGVMYPEMLFLPLAAVLIVAGRIALRLRKIAKLGPAVIVALLAPFLLVPRFASEILRLLHRAPSFTLSEVFPYARHPEGVGRLWFGSAAAISEPTAQTAVSAIAIALSIFAVMGLMNIYWRSRRTSRRSLALALLALLLSPVIFGILAGDRPYQQYKLMLAVSPLLPIGVACAVRRRFALPVLSILLVLTWAATVEMIAQSVSRSPQPEVNSYRMLDPDFTQVCKQLAVIKDRDLAFFQNDLFFKGGFRNAWMCYFARNNRVHLGNPFVNDEDVRDYPAVARIADLSILPSDTRFVHLTNGIFFSPPQDPHQWVAESSSSAATVWTPRSRDWAVIGSIANPAGLNDPLGKSFWLSDRPVFAALLCGRDGQVKLTSSIAFGPSVQTNTPRELDITVSPAAQIIHLALSEGPMQTLIPAKKGLNVLRLRAADVPIFAVPHQGQYLPLILGIDGLQVEMIASK